MYTVCRVQQCMLGPAVGMGGSWIQSGVRQLAPGRGSVALCLQHERCGHQSREAHGPGPVRCPPSLKRCASNQSERHRPAQRSGATNACAGIRSATPADVAGVLLDPSHSWSLVCMAVAVATLCPAASSPALGTGEVRFENERVPG